MYDHNQTLIPDSFLALHLRMGRPTLERSELEARAESAEAVAQQIAAVVGNIPADEEKSQLDALGAVRASLLVEPAAFSESEATWVVARAAEICGWRAASTE
jgi:hypothetical protein